MRPLLLCAAFFSLAMVSEASAQWGDLKVQFLVTGTVPKPATLSPAMAECGPKPHLDESLLVSKEGGFKNVLVFLKKKDDVELPIHVSYLAAAKTPVVIDNQVCRFEPRVATLWTDRKLTLKNSDDCGHNMKISAFANADLNQLIPPKGTFETEFKKTETLPSRIECNLHKWMTGFVFMQDHPYMAVSDADGKVDLKNIPEGEWTFCAWHELKGFIKTPKVNGKEEKWTKGQFKVTIKDKATTDFGQVESKVEQVK